MLGFVPMQDPLEPYFSSYGVVLGSKAQQVDRAVYVIGFSASV